MAVTSQASGSHKLLRDNLRGPTGEWLGVNQDGQTYWALADMSGTVSRYIQETATGVDPKAHVEFTEYGGYVAEDLEGLPAVWSGLTTLDSPETELHAGHLSFYLAGGRLFDSNSGRYLSDGGGVNGYRFANNNPTSQIQLTGQSYTETIGGTVDWSKIEGPGAFGHYGSAVYGLGDVLTLNLLFDPEVRAQTTNAYFVGAALGVVGQVYAGYWAANALRGVGGAYAAARTWGTLSTAQRFAVGYAGYAAAGDVVGVGQSGYNLATGQFTAMDLLGFAPTIGWAMGAARGLRGAYRSGIVGPNSSLAGSIRTINPNYPTRGFNKNCDECVIATERRFAGELGVTARSSLRPLPISRITDEFGGTFEDVSGMMDIGHRLSQNGNGARGVVYGADHARGYGHVWNVRIDDGVVRFLESQTGASAGLGVNNFDEFTDFKFLLTASGRQ